MAQAKEKEIRVNPQQTSSAATKYGDAEDSWLSKIQGTVNWIKIPEIDPSKIIQDIKSSILKWVKGGLIGEIKNSLSNWIRQKFSDAKKAAFTQINSIVSVGGKFIGQWNTAEAQGLRLFGMITGGLIGGAVLLGAGPEMITGMLRMSQLLYTFNFNETDKQIDAQIEGNVTSMYASAGQALGSGLANFLSGGVFKIPRIQINMTKVAILWRTLNEEARTQMLSQLKALGKNVFFVALKSIFKLVYKDTRKYLKDLAKSSPNHPIISLIPGGAKTLELWGAGGEQWSMAVNIVQKKVENLQKDPRFKNIGVGLENFLESFGEGLQEFLPELVRQPVV
jgi:hypothetical protein